jgi:hypothetical protein
MSHSTEEHDEKAGGGILEKAATTIGSVIGAVAASTGLAKHDAKAEPPKSSEPPRVIKGKFQKSGKHRLPRKLKKLSARKDQAAQTAG